MTDTLPIPSWDELFMRHAYLIASKSKDTKTKIGAVIVKNKAVISEGYNGICRGVKDGVAARYDRPEKYFWFEHAERNSIYHCARQGISTDNTILYTQGLPCSDCARGIINSGITEVILHFEWDRITMDLDREKWSVSGDRSNEMFKEAEVIIKFYCGNLGMKTLIDGRIFEI